MLFDETVMLCYLVNHKEFKLKHNMTYFNSFYSSNLTPKLSYYFSFINLLINLRFSKLNVY